MLAACGEDTAISVSASATGTAGSSGPASSTAPGGSTGGTSGGVDPSGSGTGSASATTGPAPTSDPGTDTAAPGTTTNAPQTTGAASSTGAVDPGTSTGDDTTTGADVKVVRFFAIGDTGEGNESQYMVGQAIAELCAQKGCDFGLLLGDNFYDSGVSSVDDPQFQDKFELPYEDIEVPIYVALGNHDYGGNGIGVDFDTKKAQYQVDYTKKSQLWRLPSKYYTFTQAHVELWALDTNQVMTDPFNGNSDPQKNWLLAGVNASTAAWKIAFGHHPYISNGDHGNAGAYENLEGIPLPFVTGETVKEFMEDAICGKIDVYICGHDHNIQWLEPTCGTEFIISGAGSKSEGLPGQNPAFFGMPETEGFVWIEIKDNSFTGTFYDSTGVELYTRTIMK